MPSRSNPVVASVGLLAGATLLALASVAAMSVEAGPFLLADRPQSERLALLGDGLLRPGLSIQSRQRLLDDCATTDGALRLVCENLSLDLQPAPAVMQQAAL